MRYRRIEIVLLSCVIVIYISYFGRSQRLLAQAGAVTSNTPFPNGEGRSQLMTTCSQCHSVDVIAQKRMTKKQWNDTVNLMQQRGAQATDDQVDTIIVYLSKNFGKPIYINTASPETLKTDLDLTSEAAQAIIDYRNKNGDFKTIEDLTKVPGLDTKKIQYEITNLDFRPSKSL
jgi:competence protein ComEA